MIIYGSIQSTITATILGFTAYIAGEFISSGNKESLAKRKEDGTKIGSPKGQA